MNVDNNRVVRLDDSVVELRPAPGYELLPDILERAAKAMLRGKPEAIMSRTSGGKLSRYAARRRKERRKEARNARRRNRRK